MNLKILLIGCVVASCSTNTVEQDVKEYCECVNSSISTNRNDECDQKMEEIINKYEYDPEALETIQRELAECK